VYTGAPIPVFDHNRIAAEYHGNPVKWVPVSRSRFTGCEVLAADQDGTALMQDLINHMVRSAAPPNGLRFSCGPQPAATQMNLFLWLTARQLQAPG
jgi:hypothetical protein